MDLKQLEYFTRVAELGSFTRAALALDVAQPALSRQIRLLEVELRQNLLQRNGRGALPTEAGALLLDHARGILNQVALAREELGAARSRLAGRVSIGLPPSLSRLVTVPLTLALQAAMPQARVTLTEGFSVSMYEGLRVGNLDLALLYNPEPAPELEMETVHQDELVLISPRGNSRQKPGKGRRNAPESGAGGGRSFSEIADLPLILPSRPNAFRLLLDQAFGALNRRARVVIEVDGLNAILSLVAHGVGHAVLPRYTLANFENTEPFAVHAVHSPQLVSQLQLVWSARRPATATQRKALELVKAVVSEHLAAGSRESTPT